jgi:hypothetical protein
MRKRCVSSFPSFTADTEADGDHQSMLTCFGFVQIELFSGRLLYRVGLDNPFGSYGSMAVKIET